MPEKTRGGDTSSRPDATRGRVGSSGVLAVIVGIVAFTFFAMAGFIGLSAVTITRNPFLGETMYVDPDSSAAVAASVADGEDAAAFSRIAASTTSIWLLPESSPTDSVTQTVASIATAASAAGAVPVFVVYGIPNRDCRNFSAGGLSPEEYPRWIAAIATGLEGHGAAVILEPDALALASECGDVAERVAQVLAAATALTGVGISVYLDGGHSNWLAPQTMADLLVAAGVGTVRGFATNVSNFNPTDEEQAYGEQLSALTGGAHYVIDTSRNGNGSDGQWCNPAGRALGQVPGAMDDGSHLDATVWVKNPGESDGTCNGGPAAGTWWEAAARALASGV